MCCHSTKEQTSLTVFFIFVIYSLEKSPAFSNSLFIGKLLCFVMKTLQNVSLQKMKSFCNALVL